MPDLPDLSDLPTLYNYTSITVAVIIAPCESALKVEYPETR